MRGKEVFVQITLTIPDKKAKSFLDVLHHISYVEVLPTVEIQPTEVFRKQFKELSKKKPKKRGAEEFYEDLKEAIHDVKEHIAGRKQLSTYEEFLDELQTDNA
jgi:hypothetical protein